MLHSGSGGQGRPLATGPSGPEPEPKAPRGAWREDARQTLGLSTDIAGIAACTTGLPTGRVSECLSPGPTRLLLLYCSGCGYKQFRGVQEIFRWV